MMDAAMKLVSTIASKSPVAVQGSKVNLNYSRDHTVDESLEYMVSVVMVSVAMVIDNVMAESDETIICH